MLYLDFARLRHEFIRKLLRERQSKGILLDIGAGKRPFHTPNHLSLHIDINSVNRENCDKCEIFKGSILEIPFYPETFDVIVALECFEHLGQEALKWHIWRCGKLLKDNGLLIISIPNLKLPLGFFVNLSWKIRTYTTEKEYLDKERGHKDLSSDYVKALLSDYNRREWKFTKFQEYGFTNIQEYRFMLYDTIILAKRESMA